jgi:hypothetical protein
MEEGGKREVRRTTTTHTDDPSFPSFPPPYRTMTEERWVEGGLPMHMWPGMPGCPKDEDFIRIPEDHPSRKLGKRRLYQTYSPIFDENSPEDHPYHPKEQERVHKAKMVARRLAKREDRRIIEHGSQEEREELLQRFKVGNGRSNAIPISWHRFKLGFLTDGGRRPGLRRLPGRYEAPGINNCDHEGAKIKAAILKMFGDHHGASACDAVNC